MTLAHTNTSEIISCIGQVASDTEGITGTNQRYHHKLCRWTEPDPCCHTRHLRSLRSQKTKSSRPTQCASKTGVGTTGLFLCCNAGGGLRDVFSAYSYDSNHSDILRNPPSVTQGRCDLTQTIYTGKWETWVRPRRARRVYYTTSLAYETEIESGGCA